MKQLSFFDIVEQVPEQCITPAGTHWKLFVDGASRNNPGPAGAGVYISCDGAPIVKEGFFLGVKTNNQAEYLALLLGLYFLSSRICPLDTVMIISDSQLLVRQLQGIYRVKNSDLQQLHAIARAIMQTMHVEIMHVLREDNKIADKLANDGINQKKEVPDDFYSWLQRYA